MCLEFKRIIKMIVQNIMLVGEVFQIEVSDGFVYPLGSRQNVNLYPAVVITGARVFRSWYAFRVQKDHYNDCTKYFTNKHNILYNHCNDPFEL